MRIIRKPDTHAPQTHLEISLEDSSLGDVDVYAQLSNDATPHRLLSIRRGGIVIYGIPEHLGIETLPTAYPAVLFTRTEHNYRADQLAKEDPLW